MITFHQVLEEGHRQLPGKVLVLPLSGGQDSTTCLFLARHCGARVHAVTVDYGQRHYRELDAARRVAQLAGVLSHEVVSVPAVLRGASPLVSDAHLEQYADHASLPGGIEKTFVPMRNPFFLTIAANRAAVLGADGLMIGVSQEDYGGYPDCRELFLSCFVMMMSEALRDSIPHPIELFSPLLRLSKAETVRLSAHLPGCLYPEPGERFGALAWSHTSYDGQYPPTGRDHATLLRAKGFEEAGLADPLVLRAVEEGLMERPPTSNYRPRSIPDHPPTT